MPCKPPKRMYALFDLEKQMYYRHRGAEWTTVLLLATLYMRRPRDKKGCIVRTFEIKETA